MTEAPPPQPHAIVLTEEQLRCLTSPTRREIFLTLGSLGPSSVARIASALGRSPDALYYHVRQLVQAQLVRSRGKRAATTRREEVFEADRVYLTVDTENRAPGYLAARRKMISSVVRQFGARAAAALEETEPSIEDRPPMPLVVRSHLVRLDREALDELDRRLTEIDDFVRTHTLESGGHLVSLLAGRVKLDEPEVQDVDGAER